MHSYEDNHLKIVHAHRVIPTKEVLEKHYEAHKGKEFFDSLITLLRA